MIGVMSKEEIEATLRRHRIGRIGCSANDRPYIVPIRYVYSGNCVYGYSVPGRKIEVMREQPLVCFEVDEVDADSSWRSVIAEGQYEELVEEDARREALAKLIPRSQDGEPRILQGTDRFVVFRLRLTAQSGRFERHAA
jgi:nitroimidazol reductase NimA-like FMN-containing flavoprotein (pyridoxamine 5'-phosphate oxidase superfamily)